MQNYTAVLTTQSTHPADELTHLFTTMVLFDKRLGFQPFQIIYEIQNFKTSLLREKRL